MVMDGTTVSLINNLAILLNVIDRGENAANNILALSYNTWAKTKEVPH
jgi:hypothetical protein